MESQRYKFEDRILPNPSEVRWSQGVNSLVKLETVMYTAVADFIETDVSMSASGEPIAAHPPVTKSDLSVQELLDRLAVSTIGLKLDFKDQRTVVPVLDRLAETPLAQPVILNADILNTDDARRAKINPHWFIETCLRNYPAGILSLGWRTSGKPGSIYTQENIDEMVELCDGLPAVTHPIRAAMLRESWSEVKQLLNGDGRTLTIWNTGPLPQDLKAWIKEHTDPAKCFYAVDLN